MSIEDLLSFEDVVDWVLSRANEETDGSSDWDSDVRAIVIAQHRRLVNKFPWICLEKYPPGVLLTKAAITSLTVTAASIGTSQTVTLSSAPSVDIGYWKIAPRGKDYVYQVLSGGTTATPTVDVVPETVSGLDCDIYQDELDLASDFNLFVNGLWTRNSQHIPVLDDERVRVASALPARRGWPPATAVLIGPRKLRLGSWDTQQHPIHYPYTYDPGDPSGGSAMTIESRLRTLLAALALPDVLDLKRGFAEARDKRALAEGLLAEAEETDRMRRRGGVHGRLSREAHGSPW